MINVKTIKALYDQLQDPNAQTSADLADLDPIHAARIRAQYTQYNELKANAKSDANFFDFIHFLYPNLSPADLKHIREAISDSRGPTL